MIAWFTVAQESRRMVACVLVGLILGGSLLATAELYGQGNPPALDDKLKAAQEQADAALAAPVTTNNEPAPSVVPAASPEAPSLFSLWFDKGGPLMYPITLISFVVVALGIERLFGLRRSRTIPYALAKELKPSSSSTPFDPRQIYLAAQQYPSVLANVLKAILLKAGRPLPEIEVTLNEICDREGSKLYRNVRTINLATTVAPMLGLLGTVQGMIDCFYKTANQAVGRDRSHALANGIYEALLTTFGGLVVAIPAAMIAHYFEGRIQHCFTDIKELLATLLPQLERLEGKVRITRQAVEPPPKPVTTPS